MDNIDVTKILVATEHWLLINRKIDVAFIEDFLEQFSSDAEMFKIFDKYTHHAEDIVGPRNTTTKKTRRSKI